jgi:hypothetical protein
LRAQHVAGREMAASELLLDVRGLSSLACEEVSLATNPWHHC